MADVFISYSREDSSTAQLLAHALSSRGWSVWWDRKLVAGTEFDSKIEHELEAASAVVVLWSVHSVQSRWVKSEASVAADRGVMIPVVLDASLPPMQFRTIQAVDLSAWTGDETAESVGGLVAAVAERAGIPHSNLTPPIPPPPKSGPVPIVSIDPPASSPPPTRRTRWWAIGAAGVVVLGLGGTVMAVASRTGSGAPSSTQPSTPTSTPPSTTASSGPTTTAAAGLPGTTLSLNSTGPEVTRLQELLKRSGFGVKTPDGAFGPVTEAALKTFEGAYQGRSGVIADARILVDGAEWQLLESAPTTTTSPTTSTAPLPEACTRYHVQAGASTPSDPGEPGLTLGRVRAVLARAGLPYDANAVPGTACPNLKDGYDYILVGGFGSASEANQACLNLREAEIEARVADGRTYGWVTAKALPLPRSPDGAGGQCGEPKIRNDDELEQLLKERGAGTAVPPTTG